MSYLETIKYHSHINTLDAYMYEGEIVHIITTFMDTNLALVEDTIGNIFEVSTHHLRITDQQQNDTNTIPTD
jgi:hypothetical protein